jgi:peptidoglycan/LPS O-acetylase OafA/YrhL
MMNFAPDVSALRFVFIDALRGIAAFAVLFHHLLHNSVMGVPLQQVLPRLFVEINRYSALGVQIFFVLSGFVIAHSLRNNPLTGKSLGNFILRRQLRLDPTYWLILLLALALHRVELAIPGLVTPPMPTVSEILFNAVYLQNILGVEQVVMVAWTLCIEIQFYLVFITLLATGNWLDRRIKGAAPGTASAVLVFITGLLSLALVQFKAFPAWFIHYWFYFAAGVLCYWAVRQAVKQWVFICFAILLGVNLLVAFANRPNSHDMLAPAMLVGFLTAVGIYYVGRRDQLTSLWNHRPLQYLGRISYSLYLVHHIVIIVVLRGAYKLTGDNGVMAIMWFFVAGALSIGAAHLLFISVERPSMQLASQFGRRSAMFNSVEQKLVPENSSPALMPESAGVDLITPESLPQESR